MILSIADTDKIRLTQPETARFLQHSKKVIAITMNQTVSHLPSPSFLLQSVSAYPGEKLAQAP